MPKRILIIESDAQEAGLMENILSLKGFNVSVAESKKTAVESLRQGVFDLVILDISPNDENFSIVREIREMQQSLPIITITGCERLEQCFKESDPFSQYSTIYMRKPLSIPELIKTIRSKIAIQSKH